MARFLSDALDDFNYPDQNKPMQESREIRDAAVNNDIFTTFESPRLFAAGKRHGDLEVLGELHLPKRSAAGRVLSSRILKLKCHACGRELQAPYEQMYNGGQIRQHCGCKKEYKHPPLRLEDHDYGRLHVIEWDKETGYWTCVCTECGAIIYRRKSQSVYKAGVDCATHGTAHIPPLATART